MLEFFLNFILPIIIFFLTRRYLTAKQERREEIEEFIEDNLITIEKVTENSKTVWLVYTYRENQFLAQGNSEQEAIDNLTKLFPSREFFQLKSDHSSAG